MARAWRANDRPSCCRRPILEGTERRLAIVAGGAGFGKSTLAARVAAARPTAWYTLDASDRHVGALAAGILASLRLWLPSSSVIRGARECTPGHAPTSPPCLFGAANYLWWGSVWLRTP